MRQPVAPRLRLFCRHAPLPFPSLLCLLLYSRDFQTADSGAHRYLSMTKPKANGPPLDDYKPKKPRMKKNAGPNVPEPEKTFVGQEVRGIVDGSFDAGYLLTVKVGDSPLVLRGLVFAPGLSVPLSKGNDVAPAIKSTARDQQVVVPLSVQFSTVGGDSPPAATTTQAPAGANQELFTATQAPTCTEKAQVSEEHDGSSKMPLIEQGGLAPEHASLGFNSEQELTGHEDFMLANEADQLRANQASQKDVEEEKVHQLGFEGMDMQHTSLSSAV